LGLRARTPPGLPHHRLVAYHVAVELLLAIKAANIRDAKLRDEGLRAFTVARGEGLEAFAALETAALVGDAEPADVQRALPLAKRLYALLTGLLK
jgi:hypothetical protein